MKKILNKFGAADDIFMANKKDQILIAHKSMIIEICNNTENAYIVEIKFQEHRISQISRSLLSPI